jgi:osmoprotectant transport system permease protein
VREAWDEMWVYLGEDTTWSGPNSLPALTWAHIWVSLVAVLFASAIALPAAVYLGHVRRGGVLAVSVVNIGRAIPSFALLALLFPLSLRYGFGLGFWPLVGALTLLALPPIFTNTYTGVRDVSDATVEAARGVGMRAGELVRKVEVPVAAPLILTGLRVAAVQVVATAALGPLVGYKDLGTPIIIGFTSPDKGSMLAGAIVVIMLALVTDRAFALATWWLVPWRSAPRRTADATVVAEEAVPA